MVPQQKAKEAYPEDLREGRRAQMKKISEKKFAALFRMIIFYLNLN